MMKSKKINTTSLIIGIAIGILISALSVYAQTVLSSSDVLYDNSKSKSSSDNVQGAIDELYNMADSCVAGSGCEEGANPNIVVAYKYNQTASASNYCVTGNEATCKKTCCYASSSSKCPSGTIIDYRVNGDEESGTEIRFHVLHDDGDSITMQSQQNTTENSAWYISYTNPNSYGPTTILEKLEAATASWSNVENQTYTMGTTEFLGNKFTGCSSIDSCTENTYTLGQRTAKARMVTLQEVAATGCKEQVSASCPIYMYNYTYLAPNYGGTVSKEGKSEGYNYFGYWTMSAYSHSTKYAWLVDRYGWTYYNTDAYSGGTTYAARAVVEISK